MSDIPRLSPQQQQQVDQFHAGATEMLSRYIAGVEIDMNRHAVKHGPMPEERLVFDFTRILVGQVHSGDLKVEALASMVAVAVAQGIARKRKGKA